ncbi:MAG: cyclic nucleotide-binding domain-containing protein [Chromatiales bacterium]|jgi:CRP-like cAMP-binding protein|nr:cyclic nucleotide-binding domain-containing protein [Chromatiales bacterium]
MSNTIITINLAEFTGLPLFKSVSIFDVEDVLLKCPVVRVDEGRVILAAGQLNERMYIVLRGEVSVRLESPESQPVAVLGSGDVFGELSVIDGEPTSAFVVAEKQCRLLGLDRDALWELFRRTPYMANNLLAILTRRIRNSNKQYEEMQRSILGPEDAEEETDDDLRIEPD